MNPQRIERAQLVRIGSGRVTYGEFVQQLAFAVHYRLGHCFALVPFVPACAATGRHARTCDGRQSPTAHTMPGGMVQYGPPRVAMGGTAPAVCRAEAQVGMR
jgi:hypothetical protein